MNKRLVTAACIGSFGGFVFGYDLGALSSAGAGIRAFFDLSPWVFGVTISASVWGTVVGSIVAGRFADCLDRRTLIAICSVVYTIAAAGMTLHVSSHWPFAVAMRVLCGIAIGGFTVSCPLYLSEIAPAEMRGRVVGLFQVQVGAGVVAAFSIGAISAHLTTSSAVWKWVIGLGSLPAFVLLFLLPFTMPIRPEADSERTSFSAQSFASRTLFRRQNRHLIFVATSIAVFNQLSGVNILLLYMLEIMASAGIGFSLGRTYTVVISILGMVTTLVGMAFIDRWGRKVLLYIGSAGMAVCLLTLGMAVPHRLLPMFYLAILVAYNTFFAFSQGTVVWVYLSELFPPGIRGAGQGYGATVHWITNALLISVFPWVQHDSNVGFLYIFAAMMVLQMVVIWLWYPETKGRAVGTSGVARNHSKK